MKNWIAILICLHLISACGGTESSGDFITEGGKISGSIDFSKMAGLITFDVMGGVFRASTVDFEATVLENDDSDAKNKILTSKNSLSGSHRTGNVETLDYNVGFHFSGAQGKGALVVTATGQGERTYESDTSDVVNNEKYFPLNLTFRFVDYQFYNPCIGFIRLDGAIVCKIEGSYNWKSKNMVVTANCRNGPDGDNRSLLYMASEANYEIAFDSKIRINGSPFQYSSYQYSGDISIDGQKSAISPLADSGKSCSAQ